MEKGSVRMMTTIGQKLDENNGFGPGFNFLRIALAISVLIWHSVYITTASVYVPTGALETALQSFIWPFYYAIIPMFFALSGFLVTASALRLPLREYILNRAFRIVPALGVDIFFCALVIGPIFTAFTMDAYFSDPKFFLYFGNIIGWIHYLLPGVCLDNPYRETVNGALWTVPFEIGCYVVMSVMIWLGLIRHWYWVLGSAIFLMIAASTLYFTGYETGVTLVDRLLQFAFQSRGAALVPSFLIGSALFLMKDFVPHDVRIAALVIAYLFCMGFFANPDTIKNPVFIAVSTLPLAYLVVWLGMLRIPNLSVFERGDYSYGIYLYHWPILQVIQQMAGPDIWWKLALMGIPCVTLFAMFSWHMIEKPVLKYRRNFSLVGERIAAGKVL
jgi:peptidoglycan/LPS O-acetylase OafA/YrhL